MPRVEHKVLAYRPWRRWCYSTGMQSNLIRSLILFVLAGVAIYAGSVIASDQEEIRSAISKLDVWGWILILGLSLINYGVRFSRWHWYLRRFGNAVSPSRNLLYYLAGFAFTTTPGKAGEAIRSLYLKVHGVSYTHSLATLFVERFMDVMAVVALGMLATFDVESARWPVVVAGGVVLSCLPAIHSTRVMEFLDRQIQRLRWEKLQSLAERLLFLLHASASLLKSPIVYGGLALGVLAWGAEGLAFYFILQSLGLETSLPMAVGIYAISVLAGAVSFIPGGLGSTEAVMGLLLVLVGAEPATAIAATIICRLATLWFAVVIGAVVIGGIEVGRWRNTRALS